MKNMVDLLLQQLRHRGLEVRYQDGDVLVLVGPKEEKTDEVLRTVRKFKPDLLARLRPRQVPPELADRPDLTEVHHPPPVNADDGPETCVVCQAFVRPENGRADIGLLCDRKACPFKGR
jgi:hypothetical protein